jgi:site-specific DNA-methyltransferase (adenine-specific)
MLDEDTPLPGQIGQEFDWKDYLETMTKWASEIRRVLKTTGTLWLNMGNRYGGSSATDIQGKWPKADIYSKGTSSAYGIRDNVNRSKNLMGIPYRLVLRMCDEQGWVWRNEIPWHKPNAMPSPKTDALTPTWEPFFLLAKGTKTKFHLDRIRVPHRKSSWLRQITADKLEARTGKRRTPESNSYDDTPIELGVGPTASIAERAVASLNPLGRNPGDQLFMFPELLPDKPESLAPGPEGINPVSERLYSPDWKGARHPEGSNPGDVMSSDYEEWYNKERRKVGFHSHEADDVRGQRREPGYAPVLTHPGGAAPPDVIEDFYSDPEDFWSISTSKGQRKRRRDEQPNYATFPEAVCLIPILASTDPLDLVLDPFAGSGTVGVVAKKLGRRCILIELNPKDCETAAWRVREVPTPMEVFLAK